MSAQVGIPQYKDLVNSTKLAKLRDKINIICVNFSKFASNDAIERRENESFETYTDQYNNDLIYLKNICQKAQELVNECNDTLYLIGNSAVTHHIYFYGEGNENAE